MGYFTINPWSEDGIYDLQYLDSQPAEYESDNIRIVRFPSPLFIGLNGRKGVGVVMKPDFNIKSNDNSQDLTQENN